MVAYGHIELLAVHFIYDITFYVRFVRRYPQIIGKFADGPVKNIYMNLRFDNLTFLKQPVDSVCMSVCLSAQLRVFFDNQLLV